VVACAELSATEESQDSQTGRELGRPQAGDPTESATEGEPPAGALALAVPAGKGEKVGKSPPAVLVTGR